MLSLFQRVSRVSQSVSVSESSKHRKLNGFLPKTVKRALLELVLKIRYTKLGKYGDSQAYFKNRKCWYLLNIILSHRRLSRENFL